MGIRFYENKSGGGKATRVDRRLWTTKDGRLVEDGDPEAYSLFCLPNQRVSEAEIAAHGGLPKRGAKEASGSHTPDSEGSTPSPATKRKRKAKSEESSDG